MGELGAREAIMDAQSAKHEFRLTNDGDAYGTAMMWLFTASDVLHFERDDDTPMVEFGYRPSPIQSEPEETSEIDIIREMPDAELVHFARLLNRYVDMLKANGRDY